MLQKVQLCEFEVISERFLLVVIPVVEVILPTTLVVCGRWVSRAVEFIGE